MRSWRRRLLKRASLLDRGLPRFDEHRAFSLMFFHSGLRVVALPQAATQNFDASIVHLLPTVEATALAHRANPAGAHVMHIMEEHLVPTMPPAQQESHGGMDHRPS